MENDLTILMQYPNNIIISSALFIILCLIISWILNQRQSRKRENERHMELAKITDNILKNYHIYLKANTEYNKLFNSYVASYPFRDIFQKYYHLYEILLNKPLDNLHFTNEQRSAISTFLKYRNIDEIERREQNKIFIEESKARHSSFFNSIEGRSLDDQQRTAILTDDDNNLVIAGAGSGKTTTIVGKIKYLVEKQSINPEKILLISFTKKSVEELARRVNIKGINAKTFHSFGLEVLTESSHKHAIFDDSAYSITIEKIFRDLIRDKTYLDKVVKFILSDFKIEIDILKTHNIGEQIQNLKEENFQPYYLANTSKVKLSYNFEKVKSIEECKIANYLYLNNIEYAYELPHPDFEPNRIYRTYKPDFTIFSGSQRIYLEHFGVNRNEEPAPIFENPMSYKEGMKWKRNFHKEMNSTLIETYSYENSEGVLLLNLKEKLEKYGILLKPKPLEEVWGIIQHNDNKILKKFYEIIRTFIVLMKSNNYSVTDVNIKTLKEVDERNKQRTERFLEILIPIYNGYQEFLNYKKEIDFSDMINIATNFINEGLYKRKFDYIIIDEFQDLSIGRYNLIKSIKNSNPFCKLFAVGDDWQSIYRFAGSDIALFKNFEDYFGYTEFSKIETTYRFSEPLISISSSFILKNPNQTPKNLRNNNFSKKTDLYINYYSQYNSEEKFGNIIDLIEEIINYELTENFNIDKKFLILGRYNYDIDKLKEDNENPKLHLIGYENIIEKFKSEWGIDIEFMSVHKAKGLEADIVLLINNEAGDNGFPSTRADDPILNLLLSNADQYTNGEERRLFYVALTRSKEKTILIVNKELKSKFVIELTSDSEPGKKCPKCKIGDKVLKQGVNKNTGNEWAFYSCSNYAYGCNYQEWI